MAESMIRIEPSLSNSMGENAPWRHDETLHAWWVEPGRLLAGEYPGSTTPGKTELKVRLLVDAGVGSIVDLTTPDDHLDSYRGALQVAAHLAGREVHHFAHPIPDNSVIDQDGYDRIIARIRAEIAAGRVVYVH